jgi:CRISPR system Cascade subunit CasC
MLIELHILQNFAPSNLNRDDTGAPKDCEFGGFRRARISSQCLKRSIRQYFLTGTSGAAVAERTRWLVDEVAQRLASDGRPEEECRRIAEAATYGVGFGVDTDRRTQYPVLLPDDKIAHLKEVCALNADVLAKGYGEIAKKESIKEKKKIAGKVIPAEVRDALGEVLNASNNAQLALFGRMLADLPERNTDAACQVSHAISTHRVNVEFDFYTAVDDLNPEDTAGAGMMGTVQFNSACFYRYANVDLDQLVENLGGDRKLAGSTLRAFLRASIDAIPTGKQNSMAAQNPPSLVMAVARESGLWSLANAFLKPVYVRVGEDIGLVERSMAALDAYWQQLARMYGEKGIAGKCVCALEESSLTNLKSCRVDTVDRLIAETLAAAGFGTGKGAEA